MKALLVLFGFMILFGSCAGYNFGTEFTKTVTIADIEATRGQSGNLYLFSDANGNVYQVEDSYLRFHFSASDVYFKIKKLVGKRVNVTGYGWRMPLFSTYPNVVRINKVYD